VASDDSGDGTFVLRKNAIKKQAKTYFLIGKDAANNGF